MLPISNNKFKILLVENTASSANSLKHLLESNGYQAIVADGFSISATLLASHRPDLVVLNSECPNEDELTWITSVRQTSGVPLVVVSSAVPENIKVSALDRGADDYIIKPFGIAEFAARIRVALRRQTFRPDVAPQPHLTFGELEIHYSRRLVTVSGKKINLTQTEYNILRFLSEYAEQPLTYSDIARAVWGFFDGGTTKKLQVNISNIRKKMGISPAKNRYLINEPGVGYCLSKGE